MTEQVLSRIPDMIGIVGVLLTLAAYYFLNINKWVSTNLKYVLCNLFGSMFLMISLLFSWNLSSVLIEIAWISISLIGLYRYLNPVSEKKSADILMFDKSKAKNKIAQKTT